MNIRSRKWNASRGIVTFIGADLRLRVFDQPLIEPWRLKVSWEDALRIFTPMQEYYMRHFDSPETRLRDKNPDRFSLR